MKQILCLVLAVVILIILSGCSQFEIHGIANFSENACSLGLNDGLLPGDRQFLSDYAYQDGDYHYHYEDNLRTIRAKTIVYLQYPEETYHQAKAACMQYYHFEQEAFCCQGFTFSTPSPFGARMVGYNDDTRTLVFIGSYGYSFDRLETPTESDFTEFVAHEFPEYFGM